LDLYPENNRNPVEVLRSGEMAFHKELFDCSDVGGFEEEARAVGEGNLVRSIPHYHREGPAQKWRMQPVGPGFDKSHLF